MKYAVNHSHYGDALRQDSFLSPPLSRCGLSIVLLLISAFAYLLAAADLPGMRPMEQEINLIVEDFSARLGITSRVTVALVPTNSRLASVANLAADTGAFEISFEMGFLRTLDDRELRAAVAHELGHVWIFTHFPYLQTESLANQQALKLVSRSDLGRVYEKVWQWSGKKGNLENVLGPVEDGNATRGIR
jgi:hypothetical protein